MALLYAPLAGILGLAFWTGVLTERVRGLRFDVQELKEANAEGGSESKITRLQVEMEGARADIGKLSRGMEGVQRQLGNLMKPTTIRELSRD
jgi:hypothetical protein